MKYTPQNQKLKSQLDQLNLAIDYDKELTTADIYPLDGDSEWGVIEFDGVTASVFERELEFLEAIEDHPHYEKLIARHPADLEKTAIALTPMDGDAWYAASIRKVDEMSAVLFGSNGRIWLSAYESLAMVRLLDDGGRRRVGFDRIGEDNIRGTLQLQFPDKVNWSRQVYVYEVDPRALDLAKVLRVGDFQYEYMAQTLKPKKVYTSSLMTLKRWFRVDPLIKANV